MGSLTEKVLPLPSWLSTVMVPKCCLMMRSSLIGYHSGAIELQPFSGIIIAKKFSLVRRLLPPAHVIENMSRYEL